MKTPGKTSDGGRRPHSKKNEKTNKRKESSKKSDLKSKPFVHPELKKDEVYKCDIDTRGTTEYEHSSVFDSHLPRFAHYYALPKKEAIETNFSKLPFRTKRLGKVSFTKSGKKMDDFRPVFVQQTELDELEKKHKKDLSKVRRKFKKKKKKK